MRGWGLGGGETPMVECIHLSLYVKYRNEMAARFNHWAHWARIQQIYSCTAIIGVSCPHTGTYFTKSLWAHDWNLEKILFTLILIIEVGHYFAHVMTAQLSWYMQNGDLIGWLFLSNNKVIFFQVLDYKLMNTWWFGSLGGVSKNTYELLNLRALWFSPVNKICIFQCMDTIFCVEFQRYPLKFHTKYLTHTLRDMDFIQHWNFKSS